MLKGMIKRFRAWRNTTLEVSSYFNEEAGIKTWVLGDIKGPMIAYVDYFEGDEWVLHTREHFGEGFRYGPGSTPWGALLDHLRAVGPPPLEEPSIILTVPKRRARYITEVATGVARPSTYSLI